LACTEAFLNVLVKNDFYRHEKQGSQNMAMVQQIIEEIEYYNSTEFETFELRNFLHYFEFYLIFSKSPNINEFFIISQNMLKAELEKENFDNFISKIHSLSIFLENVQENQNENHITLINQILKEMIINKMWFYRIDIRLAVEKIFK
jgi:hypothetical protein